MRKELSLNRARSTGKARRQDGTHIRENVLFPTWAAPKVASATSRRADPRAGVVGERSRPDTLRSLAGGVGPTGADRGPLGTRSPAGAV